MRQMAGLVTLNTRYDMEAKYRSHQYARSVGGRSQNCATRHTPLS